MRQDDEIHPKVAERVRRHQAEATACAGIPTEDLEGGVIEKAMRAMLDLEQLQNQEQPFGPQEVSADELAGLDEYNGRES